MDIPSYLLGKKAGGGSGGTSDYTQLSNKPQINSVELNGNKTLANLGIQSEITSTNKLDASFVDDSNSTNKFFSGNYNDLTNKPTIPDELSDLTDDSTHRLVTDTEKTTWNGKLDSSKVKSVNSTTSGDVYDVVYINNLIGDISTILESLVTVGGGN